MPRVNGVKARFARMLIKEFHSGKFFLDVVDDFRIIIVNFTVLPDKNYRAPGHPERPEPGPIVNFRMGDIPSSFAAPLLIHQDRYCASHVAPTGSEKMAEILRRLREAGLKLRKDSEADKLVQMFMQSNRDALAAIPIILPVRQCIQIYTSAPLDGFVCFDYIATSDVLMEKNYDSRYRE